VHVLEAQVTTAGEPHLDEHETVVDAGVDEVWPVLLQTVDEAMSRPWMAGYSRVVGSGDSTASGPRPLAEGSTVPGFRVVTAVPGTTLALAGRHRFSSYALVFRLEPVGADRARLRIESRAAFPGVAGGVYRLLVVGTGGHVVAVRRLLARVKRRAERRARSSP
jgi:hypothetical protein